MKYKYHYLKNKVFLKSQPSVPSLLLQLQLPVCPTTASVNPCVLFEHTLTHYNNVEQGSGVV